MTETRAKYGARSKYGAVRQEVDGYRFDSKAEARRYSELRLLELAGEIHDLQVHPRWPINVNGTPICVYVADFSYRRSSIHGVGQVVEDVKGVRTAVYKLKRRLMLAKFGIDVQEVQV